MKEINIFLLGNFVITKILKLFQMFLKKCALNLKTIFFSLVEPIVSSLCFILLTETNETCVKQKSEEYLYFHV